ncbi:MAG: sigma-54-dependent Fis family transcriptional regulator [Bryobacterales bacterium]|nr:sigma-54-dependent Fis family transcriptional regulator [Bryobacterales bacterium]
MSTEADLLTFLGMPVIVASERMRGLLRTVQRVAVTQATVLITGESGSGKEVIARALHHFSMRCTKPWVDLSCAALPEQLVESELFGYEKGAFSGAQSHKPGLFEMAHGGTLFLDEVGELEPRMQVKLLRVLDGAAYYRLGGTHKVTADVRVLAATNRPLEEAISEGRFREDLFHRLSQIHLHVPPLRERPEDILPLAEFFLGQQHSALCIGDDARESLTGYPWPGNIRELKNAVTKALVACPDGVIHCDHLPPQVRHRRMEPQTIRPDTLDGMERQMILRVLAQTNGHHQRAADLLGISRRTLSRKLKIYGAEALREMEENGREVETRA